MSDPQQGYRSGNAEFEGAVVIRALRNFSNWLTLKDFHDAQRAAEEELVARYARGNTSIQNGWYIDEAGIEKLGRKGDRSFKKIRRIINAAKSRPSRSAGAHKG